VRTYLDQPALARAVIDVAHELHVGHLSIFVAAGFAEVSRPTLRRVVMRIDFLQRSGDSYELNAGADDP
jgi:hypothetical protein